MHTRYFRSKTMQVILNALYDLTYNNRLSLSALFVTELKYPAKITGILKRLSNKHLIMLIKFYSNFPVPVALIVTSS